MVRRSALRVRRTGSPRTALPESDAACLRRPKYLGIPLRLVVVPSRGIGLVIGVEIAQDAIERPMIPLTEYLDSVSDQEGGADPLTGLMATLRPRTLVNNLGAAGGTDIGKEGDANIMFLCQSQHDLGGIDHRRGPVLVAVTDHPCPTVKKIEPVSAVDVRNGPWSSEREILGAERDGTYIVKLDQALRMREGSAHGAPRRHLFTRSSRVSSLVNVGHAMISFSWGR
jgi:hypothetical protein